VQFIGTVILAIIKFEFGKSSEKLLLKHGKIIMTFLSIIILVLLTVMLAFAFNNFGHGGNVYSTSPVKVSVLSEAPISRWNKTYGGINQDRPLALVQTSDKGYVIACSTYSYGAGSADIWLIKTDVYGSMKWNKTYGGTDLDWASALVKTPDGGYAIAGCTRSTGAGLCDVWLIKADACGNIEWDKTYGGSGSDWASALVQSFDGGYAIACSTSSCGAGSADVWLIKLAIPEFSSATILLVLMALIALTAAFMEKRLREKQNLN
jgi:hypothetical protein